MKKTKTIIICEYFLQLIIFAVSISISAHAEIDTLIFCPLYLLNLIICAFIAERVLLFELKTYSPQIHSQLHTSGKYVNNFKWIYYGFNSRSYDNGKDKTVKFCIKLSWLLYALAFIAMIVFDIRLEFHT